MHPRAGVVTPAQPNYLYKLLEVDSGAQLTYSLPKHYLGGWLRWVFSCQLWPKDVRPSPSTVLLIVPGGLGGAKR